MANGVIGNKLNQLNQTAKQADSVHFDIRLTGSKSGAATLSVNGGYYANGTIRRGNQSDWFYGNLVSDILKEFVKITGTVEKIDAASLSCKSAKSPVKGKALKELCLAAVYEFFRVTPPSAEELREKEQARKQAQAKKTAKEKQARLELLSLLAQADIKAWNSRHGDAVKVAPFRKAELSARILTGMRLVAMPETDFRNANLEKARGKNCDLSKSLFDGARLAGASLDGCKLKNASFRDADLSGASLCGCDLQGVDFGGATLQQIKFKRCYFDETTRWPGDTPADKELVWTGKGPNPAELAALEKRKKTEGPVDMDTFMKRLKKNIDKARVDKALKMLKKESFQLFVDVSDEAIAGVVKSQNDPDLVYSCRLTHSGSFACCTQNLNNCGGLRGALCKHIMVLLIGLANAGEMDADTLDDWVQRSLLHKPELDKDAMSAILLKYKGADAGEIDWRPTETVPEDFYAF